ncbi:MAG: ABC transporter ATP-binding protein [Acidimicrobiales bacterium]
MGAAVTEAATAAPTPTAGDHAVDRCREPSAEPRHRRQQANGVGIIGESGAGKSTLANVLLRLARPDAGVVRYQGLDIWTMDRASVRTFRRNVQAVMQDPFSSFDPRWPIGRSVQEPLWIHRIGNRPERERLLRQSLDSVRLPLGVVDRHPGELSGGQLQRAAIARALISEPAVIVCDEPLSALDVSIQAQIASLLLDIQAYQGVSYVIISHDLAMTSVLTHDIVVMRHGVVVETGPADEVIGAPRHEYTSALIDAVREVNDS